MAVLMVELLGVLRIKWLAGRKEFAIVDLKTVLTVRESFVLKVKKNVVWKVILKVDNFAEKSVS